MNEHASRKTVRICQDGAPSPFLFGSPPTSSDWSLSLEGYSSQTPASWFSLLQVEKQKRRGGGRQQLMHRSDTCCKKIITKSAPSLLQSTNVKY